MFDFSYFNKFFITKLRYERFFRGSFIIILFQTFGLSQACQRQSIPRFKPNPYISGNSHRLFQLNRRFRSYCFLSLENMTQLGRRPIHTFCQLVLAHTQLFQNLLKILSRGNRQI